MPKELGKLSEKEIQQRLYGKYSNPGGETLPEQKPVPNAVKKPSIAEPKEKNNIENSSGMKIIWSFALGVVVIFLTGLFIMRSEKTPQNPQASKKAVPRKTSVPKTISASVSRPYTIQVIVYESKKGAEISAGDLKKRGLPAYIKQSTMASGKPQFRVYVGEFTTQEEAKATLTMLKTQPSCQESFIRKK